LHEASLEGHAEVVLERGADLTAQDKDSRTPLHEAPLEGHADVVLERGADPTVQVEGGQPAAQHRDVQTPSHRASRNPHHYIMQFISHRELRWINTIPLLACILVLVLLFDFDGGEIMLLLVAIFT